LGVKKERNCATQELEPREGKGKRKTKGEILSWRGKRRATFSTSCRNGE